MTLATHIQSELRKAEVFIKFAHVGRDVGCDPAGGSRRRVTLQKIVFQRPRVHCDIQAVHHSNEI